ncbi:MAG: signal peptide peptidase SppA [Lysobacterales bacterium]
MSIYPSHPNSLPAPRRPTLLWRLITGFWRALEFSRRAVFNLLFLLFLLLFGILLFSGGTASLGKHTVLVFDPQGAVVEQFSQSPLDRALAEAMGQGEEEIRLRDVSRVLDAAATDPHIDRVLLVTDGIGAMGPASVREFAAALARFKQSGKPLEAIASIYYDQKTYLLAAQADQVFLDPQGAVMFEGMGRYRTYYKDLFDKLGVEAHLFRVGEFKSAGEPYIRADQSPEAAEADRYWMGDIWQRHLADIATARKLKPEQLTAMIDGYAPAVTAVAGDLSQLAIDQKLIDALLTREQLRQRMLDAGIPDEAETGFRQVGFHDYLARLNARPQFPGKNEVAIVVAEGEMIDGAQLPGTIGGEATSALLRQVRDDDSVKAVVLRVDSPGGSVFPAELIRREVELIRASGKPVVVSMGDLAASGGYWISMNADEIIADPSTITGSIGIYGLFFNVPEAMAKVGLHTDGVGTTWLAGAFDPTRPLDPRLGEMIQQVLNKGYADFIGKVADARKRDVASIDGIARGRVWTGAQARERGLVDGLGSLQDAIDAAAKRAGMAKPEVRYVERPSSAFERFMGSFAQSRLSALLRESGWTTPLAWLPKPTAQDLQRLQGLLQSRPHGLPVNLQAHCECGLR